MLHFKKSLGLRLLRCVFSLYLVITVFVTSIQLYYEYGNLEQYMLTELSNVGKSFEEGLAVSIWEFNPTALESILDGIDKIDLVEGVRITSSDDSATLGTAGFFTENEVKILSSQTIRGEKSNTKKVQSQIHGQQAMHYEYKFDIYYPGISGDEPEKVGNGYLYANQHTVIHRFTNSFILIIANAIIKTLALWIIFLYFVRYIISTPLHLLTDATKEFVNENDKLNELTNTLDPLIQSPNTDELQTLASSFSTMQKSIVEINSQLEHRVDERTAELAKANEELHHMALHDPLTNLPNRSLFYDRLDHAIEVAKRNGTIFTVISIDLTKFKEVNDTYGHGAGDIVLIEVGKRFAKALRSSDTLARLGGDEFVMILPGENPQLVISRLIEVLEAEITIDQDTSVSIRSNIGAAFFPKDATDGNLLYKYADAAMYQAKQSGMDYALFDNTQYALFDKEKYGAVNPTKNASNGS